MRCPASSFRAVACAAEGFGIALFRLFRYNGANQNAGRGEQPMDRAQRAAALAGEVIALAQSTLMVHLRFLDRALAALRPVAHESLWFAADGVHLYYEPWYVLGRYRWEQNAVNRALLHAILHCVFRHSFVGRDIDRPRWDLACDIAVEAAISGFDEPFLAVRRTEQQAALLDLLRRELPTPLTAERIYRWLGEQNVGEAELTAQREPFFADQHELWYGAFAADGRPDTELDLQKIWEDISRRMQVEMETMTADGDSPLVQSLRQLNRRRQSYTRFLRRFGESGEVMRVSEEEFDQTYYTYGLTTYGNLPLVEPLEYREEKLLREFVIAIDTSGSVKGDVVQSFVEHTYNILSRQENLLTRVNIRIMQCDDRIREDVRITCAQEFRRYLDTMEIKGLGQTDFRPVFRRVEELRQKGELPQLKGLLYFTDGRGIFPSRKPPYETAFILHHDGWDTPPVPQWAMQLTLTEDEILDQRFDGE